MPDTEAPPTASMRSRDYLGIRTASGRERLSLVAAIARAAVAKWTSPSTFTSVGHYLRRPILVRPFGLQFGVRAESDDLIFAMENHKPSVVRWFHPKVDEFVVDVGAHIGLYALYAAQRGANVLALEPNPATYQALIDNVRRNPSLKIDARNVAAGRSRGSLLLFDAGSSSGVSSLVPGWSARYDRAAAAAIPVNVLPLDEMLAAEPERTVDWLLVDAEGFEAEILAGADRTLTRTRRVIVEVAEGDIAHACESQLERSGFRILARERQNSVNSYWLASREPAPPPATGPG